MCINEIDSARNVDELKSSSSIFGTNASRLRGQWNEVLLFMTEVPDEDKLKNLQKKQLHYSKELKPLTVLNLQDTVQKGQAASCSRLKEMDVPM